MKVGIIGLGVVGHAQAEMFAERGHDLVTYDPAINPDYPGGMGSVDFAVICVGTPSLEGGRADLRAVYKAVADLPPRIPVALRSTVPPGTTDALFMDDPHARLYAHIPEFMGENTLHSWQRSTDVPYMIIGGDSESALFFRQRFATVYPGIIRTCKTAEAELAKYLANLYWANRVTFVNEFAKICDAFDVDYEHVREAWLTDPRVSEPYTQRAGYPPGFGGRCWPKDLSALIAASQDAGYAPEFLWAIQDANARFQRD
jgi:UDPglucose 6-dehydrogenase